MPVKMPNTVKNVKPGQRLSVKSSGNNSKPSSDLRRLLSLLEKPIPIQEVAAVSHNKAHSTGVKSQGTHHRKDASFKSDSNSNTSSEAHELEKFSITYRNQRCFASHPLHTIFSAILTSLVKNRLCREWIDHAPPDSVLQVLICLRLLIRDPHYQIILHQLQGVNLLARYLEFVSTMYIEHGDQPFAIQKLVTMTYMFQKLSAVEGQKCWVISSRAHMTLVNLLSTTDSSVLLGSLLALTTLAESPEYKEKIGELPIVEHLLVILQEYDLLSKTMGAELLRHLSPVGRVREQVRELEGLPVLLSLLQGQHLKLLWSVAWVVVQLCEEPDTRAEIRTWGGVRQLLRLLSSDRHFVSDRSSVEALSSANAAGRIQREHVREDLSPQEELDNSMALQSACCAALTELVLDDTAAYQVVQENGIYVIAKLILPQTTGPTAVSLQCYAFRTLRFLFSVQRNRHLFKRIFPMDLFELFIDIGHYVRDLTAYEVLQTKVSLYTAEEMHSLRDGIQALDQNRPPLKVISGYSILNHVGTGAFGSVFKVCPPSRVAARILKHTGFPDYNLSENVSKQSGQNLLALKEVHLHNPVFGKDKKSRDSNVDKIVSELTIIKEQMAHPNVVKYYKTFLEGDSLYIVMELIEGVPLADHMSSLKDKQQKFTENRIWNIFVQMCLALRYLHKEKRIVHRDLTPNNIMLGERDKVTITDFGLAKQKQENSKLTSVVGTILYSCPEVVKNEPYGEKADIWAMGCILYQMATLQPPFYSSNMLSLATKIVDAVYEPVEEGTFSERVTDMIKWCLSSDADMRPDIVAVSSRISDIMMRLMDSLYVSQNALERRADRDRQRAQKYFLERHRCGTSCHHPNMAHVLENKTESVFPLSTVSKQNNNQDDNSNEDPAPSTTKINTTASLIKLYEPFDSDACTTPEQLLSMSAYAGPKMKTRPVSAGICVSQKKVRQIDDPIQRLLAQLHKIIFITQLPPASHHDIKRRLIERFKKSLFQYGSNPFNLKAELSKLLQASTELMDLGSQSSDWWPMVHSFAADTSFTHKLDEGGDRHLKDGITYQQMQGILEEVLEENRYYNIQD